MSSQIQSISKQHKSGRTFPTASKAWSKNNIIPNIRNNPPDVASENPISNHEPQENKDLSISFPYNFSKRTTHFVHP